MVWLYKQLEKFKSEISAQRELLARLEQMGLQQLASDDHINAFAILGEHNAERVKIAKATQDFLSLNGFAPKTFSTPQKRLLKLLEKQILTLSTIKSRLLAEQAPLDASEDFRVAQKNTYQFGNAYELKIDMQHPLSHALIICPGDNREIGFFLNVKSQRATFEFIAIRNCSYVFLFMYEGSSTIYRKNVHITVEGNPYVAA